MQGLKISLHQNELIFCCTFPRIFLVSPQYFFESQPWTCGCRKNLGMFLRAQAIWKPHQKLHTKGTFLETGDSGSQTQLLGTRL